MTDSRTYNGQIPTDPRNAIILTLALAIVYAAGQLSAEQAQALTAAGGMAELALFLVHMHRGSR